MELRLRLVTQLAMRDRRHHVRVRFGVVPLQHGFDNLQGPLEIPGVERRPELSIGAHHHRVVGGRVRKGHPELGEVHRTIACLEPIDHLTVGCGGRVLRGLRRCGSSTKDERQNQNRAHDLHSQTNRPRRRLNGREESQPMSRIRSSDITDRRVYLNRRSFMQGLFAGSAMLVSDSVFAGQPAAHGRKLTTVRSALSTAEKPNSWDDVTSYNNFYEFGTDKSDPAANAPRYRPAQPWTVAIDGECAKPGPMNLEDILKGQTLEDRIYRHRCVEGWSMIIPWVGFPLASLIKRCEPTSKAAFVEFTTLHDVGQMPGQRRDVLERPYVEGLRREEA